jgi:lipoprotein NlpD
MLLVSCTSGGAPVLDLYSFYSHNQPATHPVTHGSHTVRRGETLYSIAFRYGWNFHDLARANGIASPYTIFPGEVIHFDRSASGREGAASHKASSRKISQPRAPVSYAALPPGNPHWHWPATGPILTHYGTSGSNKGINIGGTRGSPVLAAADGIVVYRGSEIQGYGNLLIIKHNDHWLSAYAHNDSMLVQEGTQVKAGQRIATLGATGTWRVQLYFEIRKDGKPVDPERLLPKR